MRFFTRVLDVVEQLQKILTIWFFFITLVVVAFQVFNRLLFHWPVLWTTDVSVFGFIWLALLSASTSVRSDAHFRVTAIIDLKRFEGTPRRTLELLSIAAVILLSLILLVLGAEFALAGAHEQSPGLAMPMIWSYGAVPLCSATALLFALERLWKLRQDQPALTSTTSHAGDA